VNATDVKPPFTVTEGGMESNGFVFESVTTRPPVGAAVETVTVQVVEAFWLMLPGLQENDDITVATKRLTAVETEELNVAVIVTV